MFFPSTKRGVPVEDDSRTSWQIVLRERFLRIVVMGSKPQGKAGFEVVLKDDLWVSPTRPCKMESWGGGRGDA